MIDLNYTDNLLTVSLFVQISQKQASLFDSRRIILSGVIFSPYRVICLVRCLIDKPTIAILAT